MTISLVESRKKRKLRVRYKLRQNNKEARLRLSVFRSNNHFYAQVIDDSKGITLAYASTNEPDLRKSLAKTNNIEAVKKVATILSERAKKAGVKKVVFDKGEYAYHGKIAVFAECCREAKILEF